LLPTTYKMLSNILLSRIASHAELTGGNQCRFRRTRSTTDQICIQQTLEKNGSRMGLYIKKAYDSGRREALYNILIELGIAVKLVRLIKMYLN
jgi:hypothetical protein